MHYVDGGHWSRASGTDTASLLELASATPSKARVHEGEWGAVVTPLKLREWERGLASHPDRDFARYVCDGIREGFRIGYNYGGTRCLSSSGNMKSVEEHSEVVEEYIQGERVARRLLGPFPRGKWPDLHVSPMGVIPKSEPGRWRIIVDLSSPEGGSVNDGVSRELCSLSYMSVDEVAARLVRLGRGALMAKFDLKAAYRNVPVHPDDRWLLGMAWQDQLYADAALPFGLRSAPAIFNAVAEALSFLIKEREVKWIDHYLDDYIVLGPPSSEDCRRGLQVALDTCEKVGFPVAEEKTVGPATVIRFLGIELDSDQMQLRLPLEKLEKLRVLVASWRKRKGCRKRELQSLAGHLNHACKVVRPGRRFLRGIFGLLSQFRKQNHMIRLNAGFRADLEWWHTFVGAWNGVSMMRREEVLSPDIHIWSDASGTWGCGALWETQWVQVAWSEWPNFAAASIAAKELLPIIVATAMWGASWRGLTVCCHCDNQSVVAVVRGGYCRDPAMAHMLRCLFFLEAKYDILLTARHVPGVENGAADAISRNRLEVFFDLTPQAQRRACPVPQDLIGHMMRQEQWTSDDWRRWLETLSMPR